MTQQSFDTPGDVLVRIDNRSGAVRLRSHSGTTTDVEIVGDVAGDDEGDLARVEHQEVGGRHRVVVEVPGNLPGSASKGVRVYGRHRVRVVVPGLGDLLRSSIGGSNDVVVNVRVPDGAAIEVATGSGEITAEGRFGAASIETSSGDTSLESVAGDLDVRTKSGDVSAKEVTGETRITSASGDVRCGHLAGPVTVKTASGDVTVESARGALSVQTASGDIRAGELATGCELKSASGDQRVDRLIAGRARLETVSGDLTVGIARSTVVAVDAETVSGDLFSEIELDPDGPPTGDWDHGDVQRVELKARTVSGDVNIRRAPV